MSTLSGYIEYAIPGGRTFSLARDGGIENMRFLDLMLVLKTKKRMFYIDSIQMFSVLSGPIELVLYKIYSTRRVKL